MSYHGSALCYAKSAVKDNFEKKKKRTQRFPELFRLSDSLYGNCVIRLRCRKIVTEAII